MNSMNVIEEYETAKANGVEFDTSKLTTEKSQILRQWKDSKKNLEDVKKRLVELRRLGIPEFISIEAIVKNRFALFDPKRVHYVVKYSLGDGKGVIEENVYDLDRVSAIVDIVYHRGLNRQRNISLEMSFLSKIENDLLDMRKWSVLKGIGR